MASVCALSIKLLSENADKIREIDGLRAEQAQVTQRLRETHQRYAIIEGRMRLGESRPQELAQARNDIAGAMNASSKIADTAKLSQAFKALQKESTSYLSKQKTLEDVLSKLATIEAIQATAFSKRVDQAREPSDAGITIMALIGALAIFLTLFLAARSSKTIGQPLETLHRTVLDLTKPENAHRRVPDGNYDPSLRELGKAVNQLAQRLERIETAPKKEKGLMNASAQKLIEHLPEPWIIADLSGRPRMSNKPARALLQRYSRDELGLPETIRTALDEDHGKSSNNVFILKSWSNSNIGYAIQLEAPKTD